MDKTLPKYPRILAIAPSTKGFGYAVFEGQKLLVDWGVRLVEGDKNSVSIKKVEGMINLYDPEVMVFEDTTNKESRRSPRIQALTKRLVAVAESRSVDVVLCSQKRLFR